MLTTYVLRVASGALRSGGLAGQVEHVGSGDRTTFRSTDELRSFCMAHLPDDESGVLPAPRQAPTDLPFATAPETDHEH